LVLIRATEEPMLYVDVLVGVLMILASVALFWYVRPIDGKVNPRLTPLTEPYAAVLILGLAAFGIITALFGLASMFA
jgi:hypothetical protein